MPATTIETRAKIVTLWERDLSYRQVAAEVGVSVIQGDGLPNQICTQCLQTVNRSFTFKQQCEKSDNVLRQYLASVNMHISLDNSQNIISDVKNDTLFVSNEVLQQSSIFNDIFNDEQTHSLVDSFAVQNADLAETMQSLRTIAEQCLPETWENEQNLINAHENSENNSCPEFTLDQLYKCQFCEESFKDEWSLGVHIKIHTGQAKYYCGICGKECNTPAALNKHTVVHGVERNDRRKNVCNCIDMDNNGHRRRNAKICHEIRILVINSLNSGSTPTVKNVAQQFSVLPDTVRKMYATYRRTNNVAKVSAGHRHPKLSLAQKEQICDWIDEDCFITLRQLKEQCLNEWPVLQQISLSTIDRALKSFHYSLKRTSFVPERRNIPEIIQTPFDYAMHYREKPYVCNICGKKCVSNVNLKVHLRTHSGEKPFRCMKCESSFATKGQLRKHNLRHTGELPYKCWHCGKAFRQKDTCDTHMRYHTGERPYLCTLCPKKYIAASHLRVHMRTHTGEKKYQCSICTKAFTEHKTLKSHMLTHTGQRPYSCKFCGRCFTQNGALNTHIRNCHTM
ncbi:zinc finger protein [Holotrichia oblita]|uniref:Zinc finger protein n=1 Tax=Holotrichia oblita TaxID=644536 RepID=A0ACB9SXW2_HOLOL|nr:zinc finger protein [Holotrichia oblita]